MGNVTRSAQLRDDPRLECFGRPSRVPEVIIADEPDVPKITFDEITEQLRIEYPCRWVYKVIGDDDDAVRAAILEVVDTEMTLELSNRSTGGKYVSFNVAVSVTDDEQRVGIYEALRAHPRVRLVL